MLRLRIWNTIRRPRSEGRGLAVTAAVSPPRPQLLQWQGHSESLWIGTLPIVADLVSRAPSRQSPGRHWLLRLALLCEPEAPEGKAKHPSPPSRWNAPYDLSYFRLMPFPGLTHDGLWRPLIWSLGSPVSWGPMLSSYRGGWLEGMGWQGGGFRFWRPRARASVGDTRGRGSWTPSNHSISSRSCITNRP